MRPQLEIYTDDVRCSHGATAGKLDDTMLFYLLSRGIDARDGAAAAEMGVPRGRGRADRRAGAAAPDRGSASPRQLRDETLQELLSWPPTPPWHRCPPAYDAERVRARLPDPRTPRQRPAAGVPGQRRLFAAAAGCDARGRGTTRRTRTPTSTAACTRSSQEATDAFEGARERVRRFINARSTREIIFVRGTTEGINLVAQSWGRPRLRPGDEILITAPRAPRQHRAVADGLRADRRTLKVAPIDRRGELDVRRVRSAAQPAHAPGGASRTSPTRSAPCCRSSSIIDAAHAHGAPVLVDGAQAVPHTAVDVQALGCDFYAFSGHKIYGPTGIGVLYGREELLDSHAALAGRRRHDPARSPSRRRTYNELPCKFEAGTPNISGAVGLGAAMDYVEALGLDAHRRARAAAARARDRGARAAFPGIELIGTARAQGRGGVLHDGGRPSARSRHHPRRRGRRGAHRPSLRHAGDGLLRHPGHRARLVRLLQHRGGRRSGSSPRCSKVREVFG